MFVFLPIIHHQAHKSPRNLYKQSRMQSAEDSSSLQTWLWLSLCSTLEKEWWMRSRSFFSCELSLTAFSLANTASGMVWAKPHKKHESLWEEKLRRDFYGFEIQICRSGMARFGVKPPAKHLCITRGLSMRSMLYHRSASCSVFWWVLKQLARVWFPQASLSLMDSRSNQKYTKSWFSGRFGPQEVLVWMNLKIWCRNWLQPVYLAGDRADPWWGRQKNHYFWLTKGHQAARTQIQGGWCKSWSPSHIPSKVQKS